MRRYVQMQRRPRGSPLQGGRHALPTAGGMCCRQQAAPQRSAPQRNAVREVASQRHRARGAGSGSRMPGLARNQV